MNDTTLREGLVAIGADAVRSAYDEEAESLSASLLRVANAISRLIAHEAQAEPTAEQIDAARDAYLNATRVRGIDPAGPMTAALRAALGVDGAE